MESSLKSEKTGKMVAALLLCLAMLVMFWPVVFQGKVLVPGDIPNTDPFLSRGADYRPPFPQNTLLSDQIEQFYVMHRVTANSLDSEGHIPLWNPYIFTGQPMVANSQSSLFYPPNLLLHLLSPGKVATLRIFFNLIFAGFFTFLFCRELRISTRGSILSAVTFALSGPVIVWVGFPLANVLCCLPFLMWGGERLLKRPDLLNSALLGLGVGLSLLGGHPETSFQVLAVFSLYFLARVATAEEAPRGRAGALGGYALAVLLGFLISAIQILPFLDFMRQSSTFARGGRGHAGASLFFSEEWLANLATAFTLFCPNFFGNPLDHNYIWPFSYFQNYNEQSVYFGLVPLALAAAALCARKKSGPLAIVAVLALFCLAVAWRLPGFEGVSHLPVFSMAPNKRLRLPFVFLTAVMAGFGFDAIAHHLRYRGGERKALVAGAAVLGLGVILFVWIVTLRFTVGPSVPPDSFRHELLYNVFSFAQWRTYLPLAIALAVGAGYFLWRDHAAVSTRFPALLIGATLLELTLLGYGYNPAVPESEILPPAPAVEFLKQSEGEPFRILTTDGFFYPNFCAAYGICDVAGYDVPVYQRYSDLYLGQGGRSFGQQIDSRQQWDPEWPLVDFLNVRYVVTPRTLGGEKFREVHRVRNLKVYRNLHALPRAFMVYDSEVIPDRKALLDRMLRGGFDFGRKALLEEAAPPLPRLPAPAQYSVQQKKYASDEVVLQVASSSPGMLVMSDLFTPDWTVTVDGARAKLYRADYTYRGVSVPQGTHTVTFRYQPASYRAGAALSLGGLLAAALAAAASWRHRVRQGGFHARGGDREAAA